MQLHSFSEASLLTEDLIEQLKNVLCDAINKRGHAYLVLSGGKTPINLFKGLANTDLPWDKVTITLADERCVAIDDSERNEHLVRQFLLQNHASRAHFVSLLNEECSIEQTERIIASLPTFDAVVLGMGEDGHTASLFPCSDELLQGLDDNAGQYFASALKSPLSTNKLVQKKIIKQSGNFFPFGGSQKIVCIASSNGRARSYDNAGKCLFK